MFRIARNSGDLLRWWHEAFTDDERSVMSERYQPLGLTVGEAAAHVRNGVLEEELASTSAVRGANFLSTLATWFRTEDTRSIAYRLVEKAESLLSEATPVLDRHYLYQAKAQVHHRWRDLDEHALDRAVEACRQQIEMACEAAAEFRASSSRLMPEHHGFKQLAIIEEKRGDLEAAWALAATAQGQGWAGDWEKRLGRLAKKLGRGSA